MVNQIEFHPYLQQNSLRKFHAENDILTEAYAPLVPLTTKSDGPLTAVVDRIAEKEGKTPAQVSPALPTFVSQIPVRFLLGSLASAIFCCCSYHPLVFECSGFGLGTNTCDRSS